MGAMRETAPDQHRSEDTGHSGVWVGTQTGASEAPPGPPRPSSAVVNPRGGGRPRWATAAERGLAAEWCLRQFTLGRQQRAIAAELGVSQSTVHSLISQALSEHKGLAVEQLRTVRGDQLTGLLETLTPHIVKHQRSPLTGELLYDYDTGEPIMAPDLDVIDRVMRVTTELAKLEGSAAPAKVQVSRSSVDQRLEELAEELLGKGAGTSVPVE